MCSASPPTRCFSICCKRFRLQRWNSTCLLSIHPPHPPIPTHLKYSKTCAKRPLSKRPKMVFKRDNRLMQVKSIAECSLWSILQYFRSSLSYQLFCFVLSILVAFLHRFYCNTIANDFPKSFSKKKNIFHEHYQVSNSLDPDKDRHSVSPDLGPNCLQRLSAESKSQSKQKMRQETSR